MANGDFLLASPVINAANVNEDASQIVGVQMRRLQRASLPLYRNATPKASMGYYMDVLEALTP